MLIVLLPWVKSIYGQCADAAWLQGDGLRGVDGRIDAVVLWKAPRSSQPLLVAAGGFAIAGTTFANNIAAWDGLAWTPLGSGINGEIRALAVLANGDLVAAGTFAKAGTITVNNVARWDGSNWSPLATGIDSRNATVNSAVVLPNGDLIVGGFFSGAGTVSVSGVARWDGNSWNSLGTGISGGSSIVNALLPLPGGKLVASGNFISAGGTPAANIAQWDGIVWSALGNGSPTTGNALASLPNGDLVVGNNGGAFRWDGLTWTNIGFLGNSVDTLAVLPGGDPVAGGGFSSITGTNPPNYIARWDGATWQPLSSGVDNLVTASLVLPNGDLVAAGGFVTAGDAHASHIARWDGKAWNFYGRGFGGNGTSGSVLANIIYALTRTPSGDIVGGGAFKAAGGVTASNIARWNGTEWSPLGGGMSGEVRAVTVAPNGDLIAGGNFEMAEGVVNNGIARWNGSIWSPLGSGLGNTGARNVHSVAVLKDGNVVAGGGFLLAGGVPAQGLAEWNGTDWSALGGGVNGDVTALIVLPNGDLIVGGSFTKAGGNSMTNIARWDGLDWSPLGAGVNSGVASLVLLPNGNLVAGGQFGIAGGTLTGPLALWDGVAWKPIGARLSSSLGAAVNAVTVLANGNIVVAGAFSQAGTLPVGNVALWDGTNWQSLGSGTANTTIGFNHVYALAPLNDGGFVMGGPFVTVSGVVSPYFAQWDCLSASQPLGLSAALMSAGSFRFSALGTAGKLYDLEYSTNLTTWQTIQQGLSGAATFQETNSNRASQRRAFYRGRYE